MSNRKKTTCIVRLGSSLVDSGRVPEGVCLFVFLKHSFSSRGSTQYSLAHYRSRVVELNTCNVSSPQASRFRILGVRCLMSKLSQLFQLVFGYILRKTWKASCIESAIDRNSIQAKKGRSKFWCRTAKNCRNPCLPPVSRCAFCLELDPLRALKKGLDRTRCVEFHYAT